LLDKFIYKLFFILLFSLKILANIIYVPGDYYTIQEAIDNAAVGDTVLVFSGTYPENIDFLGKDIIVGSQYLITKNIENIFQTIIQGQNNSVVTFNNGESNNAILCGFTITQGTGTIVSTISGMELFGGGIFINHSSPTIKSNVIINNDMITGANRGGGIAIKDFANPLIYNNTIIDNDIKGFWLWINYFGGGIWIDSTSNPVIGGDINYSNNIYLNSADYGYQIFRNGPGNVINAQYNYWGNCPPDSQDVFPLNQFDVSNCLENPVGLLNRQRYNYFNNYYLSQNYPNPFNSSTTFHYSINKRERVQINVYDISGKLVRTLINEEKSRGNHTANWDGKNELGEIVSSGIYFYSLKIRNTNIFFKRMVFIK